MLSYHFTALPVCLATPVLPPPHPTLPAIDQVLVEHILLDLLLLRVFGAVVNAIAQAVVT